MFLGNLPPFDLRQSEVGYRHFEGKLGHPNREASNSLICSIFDEHARVRRSTQLRPVHVNGAARWRDLWRVEKPKCDNEKKVCREKSRDAFRPNGVNDRALEWRICVRGLRGAFVVLPDIFPNEKGKFTAKKQLRIIILRHVEEEQHNEP